MTKYKNNSTGVIVEAVQFLRQGDAGISHHEDHGGFCQQYKTSLF